MKEHLLLGTAGHIDHGKTSLVRALTGVDCDRLPDERRRQITIDLGFAPLDLGDFLLGVVDVPGHERFIKNMLAGATGIDLALLVVAADEAVKPQTREHVEILEHLQLPAGVIAITKCDLAEDDWIDLVVAEVQELTGERFLAGAPVVRVSATTGQGLPELRIALGEAAAKAAAARRGRTDAPLRMNVDRAFSLSGHGTVVTGSIASGHVAVGDRLTLYPGGVAIRVRGLESHDAPAETLAAGRRAAINLAGVHYDEVRRGDVLAAPDLLRASRIVTVRLTLSEAAPRTVRSRTRVRFHLGSAEVQATVRLLDAAELSAGESCFAQLFLAQPVAPLWGDPFVVRAVSPTDLLGGGRIIDPWAQRRRRLDPQAAERLGELEGGTPRERIAAAAYLHPAADWLAADLFALAGVAQAEAELDALVEDERLLPLTLPGNKTSWLQADVLASLIERIERRLAAEHAQTPLDATVELSRLDRHFPDLAAGVFAALLSLLEQRGVLVRGKSGVALPDWSPRLTEKQQTLFDQLTEALAAAELDPPSVSQLASDLEASAGDVESLLRLANQQQRVVRLDHDLYLHADAAARASQTTADALRADGALTVSEIRSLLATTRRIAIPLCEYFDGVGLTRREGDVRRLANDPSQTPTAP